MWEDSNPSSASRLFGSHGDNVASCKALRAKGLSTPIEDPPGHIMQPGVTE